MLTESEKRWLERRERHEYPFCISCGAVQTAVDGTGYCYPIENCPLEARIEDWQEAAEFEARVAVKLAEIFDASTEIAPLCPSCPCEDDCYSEHLKCSAAVLKYARLQVEEEMDDRT